MNKCIAGCLLGFISLSCTMIAQAQQPGGNTEKAIAALETRWAESQKTNNPDLAAPLLADKFISTGLDGKVSTRTQALADAKATKYTSVDIEDVHITVFGDAAIASLVFNAKGTDSKGKVLDEHSRWTDTWVKMPNGTWQCVASHGSEVKM
jgi:hypothetical protein